MRSSNDLEEEDLPYFFFLTFPTPPASPPPFELDMAAHRYQLQWQLPLKSSLRFFNVFSW